MKMLNLKIKFTAIFLIGFYFITCAQFRSKIQILINEVKYSNGNLAINYQINNAKPSDNIRVWIDIFNSKKDTIRARTWRGDVNKLMQGDGDKVAVWDIFKDGMELIDSVTVKIFAPVEEKFYLDDPLILSTIYPGWGDYHIRSKNPYWIYGALGYSLVGASINTYFSAINNYNKYLASNSLEERNKFHQKAVTGRNLTFSLIGTAGLIWAIDYYGLIKRKKEINKSWKKNAPVRENPSIPDFKITSANSEKIFVNTRLTNLELVDGSVRYIDLDESNCLDAFEEGYIEFKLKNHGPAKATNFFAKINPLHSSKNIYFADSIRIENIAINKTVTIRLPIRASSEIGNETVKLEVCVFSHLNNPVAPFSIEINTCKFEYKKEISSNEFISDIDKNIPYLPSTGKEKFALIIGNECYTNQYTKLSQHFNVPFARHDAISFKNYSLNILGVKESNIVLLLDATKKEMYEGILNLVDRVKKVRDGAELIFYYAGQGLSDTNTMAPYMMPVDIAPDNLPEAISLDFFYKYMWESRSTKSLIVIDASFNNGGRNMGLRGPSAKIVHPRSEVISGNTVVFNAVSEKYTANAYPEMKHGLFTYCFLKSLKETKGNINFRTLDNILKINVNEKALAIKVQQLPTAQISIAVRDIWQDWKIH
jgi:hypothetical protein